LPFIEPAATDLTRTAQKLEVAATQPVFFAFGRLSKLGVLCHKPAPPEGRFAAQNASRRKNSEEFNLDATS